MELFSKPSLKILDDAFDTRIKDKKYCKGVALTGVPWDWSTGGDPGARHAPEKIRNFLYKLPDYSGSNGEVACKPQDYGDIIIEPRDYKLSMNLIKNASSKLFKENEFTIFLGGDHSISKPILEGLLETSKCIGLVMLDAHFDLRSIKRGTTSGSWLWELYQPNKDRIYTVIIGISEYSNPSYLARRANELGIQYYTVWDVWNRWSEVLQSIVDLKKAKCEAYYVTVDIDHLDVSYAPGVNSPAIPGLTPKESMIILDNAIRNLNPKGIDFVEVVPIKDISNRTVALTAKLALFAIQKVTSG